MLFAVMAPPVKKWFQNTRRCFETPKFKIFFPLNMPRAMRRAFPIVLLIEYKKARRQSSASLSVGGLFVKQRGKRLVLIAGLGFHGVVADEHGPNVGAGFGDHQHTDHGV